MEAFRNLPVELVNSILTFRPRHPLAEVLICCNWFQQWQDAKDKFSTALSWKNPEDVDLDKECPFHEFWARNFSTVRYFYEDEDYCD